MKKIVALLFSLLFLLSLSGCGEPDIIATVSTTAQTEPVPTVETTVPVQTFSYSDLQLTEFLFSSGAGAWGTTLYIESDGSFSGTYHDSEMGNRTEEYPNGTVYHCAFYGQFGTPVQVNDDTYSLPIQVLRYEQVPDSQQIRDGVRYCYTTAFGIEQTLELLLYAPGTLLDSLPMEYRQWVGLHMESEGVLPYWGLYNEAQQQGFAGMDLLQRARDAVTAAETEEAAIRAQQDSYVTQADMNMAAQQRYNCWDTVLNQIWELLKRILPQEDMISLTGLQLEWIAKKDAAAQAAAAEFEGGSLVPLAYADAAADWTRERVYYLLQYLP